MDKQWRYDGFDQPEDSGVYLYLRRVSPKWRRQKSIENALKMKRSPCGRHLLTLSRSGVIEKAKSSKGNYYIYRVVVGEND